MKVLVALVTLFSLSGHAECIRTLIQNNKAGQVDLEQIKIIDTDNHIISLSQLVCGKSMDSTDEKIERQYWQRLDKRGM